MDLNEQSNETVVRQYWWLTERKREWLRGGGEWVSVNDNYKNEWFSLLWLFYEFAFKECYLSYLPYVLQSTFLTDVDINMVQFMNIRSERHFKELSKVSVSH